MLALSIVFLVPSTSHAQAIEGVVISGRDSTAVPGSVVLMHRVTAVAGEVVDSVESDSRGRFSLSMDSGDDQGTLYAVAALNDGISYFGPALHPGMEPPNPYTIVVYETETIDGPLPDSRIMLRHVVVSPSAHGLLQVTEVVDVAGVPNRALATTSPADPMWTVELPAGVQSWTPMAGGLPPEAMSLVGNRLEVRAKLPPTGMRVAFSYFRDGPGIDLSISHPTDRIEVILVGAEEKAVVGLSPGSSADLPPTGNAKRFVAAGVEPGAEVSLTLESESAPTGPVLIWVFVGLALLAAAALSAVVARRTAG
jgi:hypothetical protein